MNASEHLEEYKWSHPSDYGGFSPEGDYVIATRHRDSSILEDTNYSEIMAALEEHEKTLPEAPERDDIESGEMPYVYDFRAGHWAVGWVEYLLIRQDAPDSLKELAGEILCSLEDYPVFNDEAYYEAEGEAVKEYWQFLSMSDRIEACESAGVSIFAARRDSPDSEIFYYLRDNIDN